MTKFPIIEHWCPVCEEPVYGDVKECPVCLTARENLIPEAT